MSGNVGPKRRESASAPPAPPHLASKPKALPRVTRRVVDSTTKKERACLADLRDADKAKVARLINHVMVALKENQRLKKLLEVERSTQEALVAKLQQRNHEVVTEVSELRLKLASMQLTSSLPSQKVYLHMGKRPSLSPIREAESCEVESEGTGALVPQGIEETQSMLREKENQSSDFITIVERKGSRIYNNSEGTEQCVGSAQMRELNTSNSQADVSTSRGKENKNPELLLELTGDSHMASEEDAGVLRKRPPPRPLPDLLSNILHRCRDVGCAPSADLLESSVKSVSEGDSLIGSVPILQGKVKSTVPKPLPQPAQAMWSCVSLAPDSVNEASVDAAPASQGLHGLSTHIWGDQPSSSHLTNCPCRELLGRQEKERDETSNHEDLVEPKLCASQKKLRFDPTAGEEGMFYYASDVEKNLKWNLERGSRQPAVPEERQGVQVGEKTERLRSNIFSMEGQRLDKDPLESHWTPEAIERRNSFHRIPVISPRSMNDNQRQPGEQTRLVSDSLSTRSTDNNVSCGEEHVQLPTSEKEVLYLRNGKPYSRKSRPSSRRTMKCINCSSVVPLWSRNASQSSKLCAKHARRCSKCSTIVESIHKYQENEKSRGRMKRRELCSSKGKRSVEVRSVNETYCRQTENFSVSDPSTSSRSGNMARCRKCTTRPKSKFKPVKKKRRGQVGTSYVPVDEKESNAASVVCCVASDDMYMFTHSSTDYSTKTRVHVPSSPLTLCGIQTKKVKKKRGNRHEMKSVKLHCAHSSGPTQEVFDVNRAILDMLQQSDGEHTGHLQAPLGNSTECWIETWRFGKPCERSCKEPTDKKTSKASSGSFAQHQHGQLDADSDLRRGLKLGCEGRQRARQHHHVRARKQSSEAWKRFDVDDLLDRFIQSNAEYSAELIKCSVYFESNSSRPSSQSKIVSDEAAEDCNLSNLPFQNSIATKQGIGSHIVSSKGGLPRTELLCVEHNEFTSAQPCPEESVRCSNCGDYIKPRTVLHSAGAIKTLKTKELRELCDSCSASVTPKKTVVRRSAHFGPDKSTQSANDHPPIVLPRLNWVNAQKIYEAGRQQKSIFHPSTSETLICDVKKSGDWTADAFDDHPHASVEDHQMPIVTGVSVRSWRSTSSMELEEDGTAKELTEMFDMSLYDLVKNLEGQRRDYWRRVNSHSIDQGTEIGKQCNSRRQPVYVDKLHGSFTTRTPAPIKQVHPNYFR